MNPKPARPVLEEFEPRILYSADFAPAALAGLQLPGPSDQRLLGAQEAPAESGATAQIAFVDVSLPDAQRLIDDLQAQRDAGRPIEIVRIERGEDGIARITETLESRTDVGAVHLLSHGSAGVLQLGSVTLDAATLLARAGDLAQWSAALSADADLLLYGCDVAASATGRQLLAGLATLTRADVAASDDLTGSALRGGDWTLEVSTGGVQAGALLSASAQQTWSGVLLASTNETRVNQATVNDQLTSAENRGSQQAVALDAAGNYVVVWTSLSQDGAGQGVYARRFDSTGAPISGEVLVNTTTNNDQKWARVASDATGNFVVTWTSENQDGTPTSVYARRFNASGVALNAEARVNTTNTGAQTDPVIAMNAGNGEYVVAWQGEGPSDTTGIFFRRFNANGTPKDASDRLANLANAGTETNPAVTMDGSGNFAIAWEVNNHVHMQRFNAAGSAQGSAAQVDSGLSTASGASMASDAAGNFTVVYQAQNFLPGLSGVWGKGFNADGTTKYSWVQVDSGDATSASIDMASDGSFVVTYEKTGDGNGLGVFARKYNADGSAAGTAFQVNQTTSGTQSNASLAVIDTNNYVVVWSGNGPGDTNGVFARQFGPLNPAPVNTVPGAQTTNEDTAKVFSAANGNQISITDADAGGSNNEVTLSVTNGSLTLAGTAGLSFTAGDGTADTTMTFRGTASAINSALNGLSYSPTPSYNGSATLTLTTKDSGLLSLEVDAGLRGRYAFESAGALGTDTSPTGGYPGTVSGVASVNDGTRGNVLSLAGAGYVQTTGHYGNPSNVTLAAWVNLTSADSTGAEVISLGDSVVLRLDEDDNLLKGAFHNGSTWVTTTYATTLAGTGWHHVAYSFNNTGNAATLYLDGVAMATTSTTSSISYTQGANSFIGKHGNGGQSFDFNGRIDDARIYNRALNAIEIATLATDLSLIDSSTVAIAVSAVNDAPAATNLSAAEIYTEDTVRNLTDIVVSDVDSANVTATLTLSNVAAGSLNTGTSGAVTSTFVAGVWTASGAIANVNTLLAGLSFTPSADFNGNFTIATSVSDGVAAPVTGSKAMTGTAVNDAPVITSNGGGASAPINVAENATAVTTVTATDADLPAQTLTYSISGGADAARFTINTSTGALSFSAAPNYEAPTDVGANNVYDVTVRVSDGTLTDTQAIAVTVTPVSDINPVITSNGGGASATVNVAENTTAVTTVTATDADLPAQTLTYSISGGADAAKFAINASTGVLSFVAAPNYEVPTDVGTNNVYDVIVQASDGTLTDTQAIAVTVTAVNDNNPVITSNGGGASAAVNVAENATAVTTVTATDADLPAQTLTYSISGGADAARFTINTSTGALSFSAAPNYEAPTDVGANNVYDVTVQASDGTLTDTQAIAVTVTPVNDANPVITSNGGGASATVNVAENATAVTTVTATDADLPAQTLTYSISGGADAAKFTISASTGVLSFIAAPNYEVPSDVGTNNVYDVTVQVSDGTFTDTQAIAVTVTAVNDNNPVITSNGAGASAAVDVAENAAAVTTVAATDADLPAQTLTYSISGGADAAKFTINTGTGVLSFVAAPNYEVPSDAGANNVYDVIVQASDGTLTDTQAIAVTVSDANEFPVGVVSDVNAGANSVAENAGVGTVVGVTANAIDPDATTNAITYTLDDSAAGRFAIDAATGVVRVAGALDYETSTSHAVTVRATSADGSFATALFTIAVSDVNDGGVGAISDANAAANGVVESAAAGTLVGLTAFAIDPDDAVTYSLTDNAGGRFAIDATSGAVVVAGALDAETATGHNIVVRVDSMDGSFNTQTFTVAVADVNEYAIGAVSDTDAAVNVVDENAAIGTLVGITASAVDADATNSTTTYTLDDSAGGRFAIAGATGVVSVAGAIDREVTSSHAIVVRATSADGSFAVQGFTIAVSALNDNAPDITSNGGGASASINVAENASAVTTVTASDADLPAQTLSYAIVGGADQGLFNLNVSTGVLSFNAAPDYESAGDAGADNVYDVVVQVSDGSLSTTQAISVTVTPLNDASPDITSNGGGASASINVAENASAVTTVTASDADLPAQTLSYAIVGGADQGLFNLNVSTGVLSFNAAPDYESAGDAGADNVYDVVVQVSDGSLSTTQAISVTVTPLNDASPDITSNGGGASASINVAENASAVTTVTASDADLPAQTLSYAIVGGADQGLFNLNVSTGVLSFNAAPDYESAGDAGADNVYDVVVQVSDGSLSTTQAISVTVTPLNDASPDITSNGGGASASINVAENASAVTTVTASDADLPAQTLSYAIVGGADQGLFNLNVSTGVLSFNAAPDYESAGDAGADNVYDVVVQVSDGSLSTTQAISVTVTPLNDASPDITSNGGGASASINVAENASAVTTVTASDADLPAQTLSYAIVGGADQGLFNLNVSTGVLSFNAAPDYESAGDAGTDNVYDVVVQVSDGSLSTTQAISVTVTPLNDNTPVISLPAPQVTAMSGTLVISTARGNAITLSDGDAGTGVVEVTLGAPQGSLTLSRTGGLSFVTGDGSDDASMRFTGTLADVNDALDGLRFTPQAGVLGVVVLNIGVDDLGNSGGGGPLSASADLSIEVADDRLVNTVTAHSQTEAATAMDAVGNYVVTWTSDGQDGGGKGIYAQRYDGAGNALGAAFQVNTTTAGDQMASSVAMASGGEFVVTWVSADGSGKGVFAQLYDANGVAQGGQFQVNSLSAGDQEAPVVAMAADGSFAVAWASDSGSSRDDVFVRRFDTNGAPIGVELRVNTALDKNQFQPALAMNAAGAFVVAWTSTSTTDGSGTGVYAQRFNADGSAAGSEFQVNSTAAGNQDRPAVAMGLDASFVVAWTSGDGLDGDKSGVFAQRYAADGTALGGEFQVNTHTNDAQSLPTLAIDHSGAFTVAWSSKGQDGNGLGVYAQRYDASGARSGLEYRVNATVGGDQTLAAAAAGQSGQLVVAWQGNGPDDGAGIFQRLIVAPNDAPVITLPGVQSTPEDTALVLSTANGNRILIADPDAYGQPVLVTLLVSQGTLSLAGNAGLTFSAGTGSADASMTFTGTLADINIALDGLRFDPLADFAGAAALSIAVDDQGNSGSGGVLSASASVAITVAARHDAPTLAQAIADQTANEGTVFTFAVPAGSFTDIDPGDTLSYSASLTGGAALPLWLSFDAATRTFSGTPMNADVGSVSVRVTAVDASGASAFDDFTLTVVNVNDAPLIGSDGAGASASISVAENNTAVTTVGATDVDLPAQTLVYSIAGGADAARFTIDVASGALSFVAAPDYDSPSDANGDNVYEVIAQVSDGTLADSQAIAVTVTATNDSAPVIGSDGGAATAGVNVAENTTAVTRVSATDADLPTQTLVYSIVGGADAAHFTIDATTGVLSFVAAPDHESPSDAGADNVYDVTVQASDGALTDNQAIAVTVGAANDSAPLITSDGGGASAAINIAENANVVTTVTASDADLPAQTLSYSIVGGADSALFGINASTGVLSFASAPDYESPSDAGADNVYDVTVQVSDGSLSSTQAISVTVNPLNDVSPDITSDGGGASAAINVAENVNAVTTVTASDADLPAQTLAFSISGGADAAHFAIDPISGALRFITAPDREVPADADADNQYEVTVTVSDGVLSAQQALSIDVGNVDEAPTIVSNRLLLSKDGATMVLLSADPDTTPSALNYVASGQVGGRFELVAAPGVAVTGFSQAQVDAGAVRFVPDGSGTQPTYVLSLSDGVSTAISGAPDVVVQAAQPDAAPPPVALAAPTPEPTQAATVATAAPAAPPPEARPELVPVAPGPVSQALLSEARDELFEPARAPSNNVSAAVPVASTATRDSTVTAVATLAQFALLSEGSENAGTASAPTLDLTSALRDRLLGEQLDQQRDSAQGSQRSEKDVQAASAMLTTGLSVGYVLWLARGGVLVASLMSALPAWAMVDPLPVLAQIKRRDGQPDAGPADDDDANDPLEKLFSKARQVVARGTTPPATPLKSDDASVAQGRTVNEQNSTEQPA